MIPTEVAEHFNFTLPAVSAYLRVLKEADLVTEEKRGKNRFYSLKKQVDISSDFLFSSRIFKH
jgi:DNA-binding transcriptional ArsR family regulator